MKFKKIIPSSLLGRSLIIVFIPIITLVTLTTLIFYQTSWNIISKRLTQSVVADINVIVKLIDQDLQLTAIKLAKEDFKMKVELKENANLNDIIFYEQRGILSKRLKQALSEINIPFSYDLTNLDKGAIISLQINANILEITVDKDRLYSESAFVFLIWMFFASLILLFLAYFFMKGQMRPLKRLAIIAETFGRGLDAPELKGSGSLEIRQTTNAFNLMQNRIKRFLKQRTEMLAGVSHDLRTPLTRMKLQLSLMKDDNAKKELEHDINEMTAMLNSYVSFVRGEAAEKIEETNINELIENICKSNSSDNFTIKYNFEDGLKIITPYLENYWPRLKPYIETLFISYNREIVGRLSSFIYLVLKSIESYNPRIFLYSSGTRDVLDCVTAYIANQKNIPVIYFQHGGAQTFQYSIFQKYVENDEKIIKTLIMDSKLEQQQIKNYGSISKAYGSPLVYNFIHNGENTVKKDILYLSSPFPSSTFRSVINGNTEINFYKTSNDILEVIHNFKLNLDIKIHPVELDKQYQYYSNIISENDFVYFKIIKSLRAETILKNYSLIILDMVGTTLLSYVLALKTPIIIYLKDISIINNISKKDLYERCYIIDNKYDFNKLISSHANNELPSKWSEQMIDRYIYPIEKGDPSKNVVCYMKNLLKKD